MDLEALVVLEVLEVLVALVALGLDGAGGSVGSEEIHDLLIWSCEGLHSALWWTHSGSWTHLQTFT